MMSIKGAIGSNTTKASVGAFEVSGTAYLVAGNSVIQDSDYSNRSTRNIFISSVPTDNPSHDKVQLRWITNHPEDSGASPSTPHLVKIDNNNFVLLWTESGSVKYILVDGNGVSKTEINSFSGTLSDCKPIVWNNSILWYSTNDSAPVFYQIAFSGTSLLYKPHNSASSIQTASEWAREGIASAISKGFVPTSLQDNYADTITRAEFCLMALMWLEYKTGKNVHELITEYGIPERISHSFKDTTSDYILTAYRLGITNGTIAPANGKPGVFSPHDEFTREQAATMVMNTCKAAGMNVNNTSSAGFTDISEASDWAVNGINFVKNNGIMGGTSSVEPVFSPKGIYTRQESIITFSNIN